MEKFDFLIIGAGIVGLATAYEMLKKDNNISLCLLEKEEDIALHQTKRNSGVIHSGLYYKPGSFKAKNCTQGRKELINFCDEFNIKHEKCGKIIVAAKEKELPQLYELERRGKLNGVEDLEIISEKEIKEIEPHVSAIKALKVPNCEIVDYYVVAKELKKQSEKLGGKVFLKEKVLDIKKENGFFSVITQDNVFQTKNIINCAGLYSDRIAKMAMPNEKLPLKIVPFRGEYYEILESKKHLVKALIYPTINPEFPFLGVHMTRMIDGTVEAGPNAVLAFAREGYKMSNINIKDLMDSLFYFGFIKLGFKFWKMGLFEMYRSLSKRAFLRSINQMLPDIKLSDIKRGNCGIRAQAIDKKGGMVDDFAIIKKENMVHVLNAPSPAATASLSIGKYITDLAFNKVV